MDRSAFIKSLLTLTGSAFLYGCRETLDELTPGLTPPPAEFE